MNQHLWSFNMSYYPLLNVYIAIEHHHFWGVNQLFRLGHFQVRKLSVYQRVYPINIPLNHYKIPLNHYKIPLNHYKIPLNHYKSHYIPGRVISIPLRFINLSGPAAGDLGGLGDLQSSPWDFSHEGKQCLQKGGGRKKIPSGKLTVCYGKSPFLMGKTTISMAIFNSYVKLPEGNKTLANDTKNAKNYIYIYT